MIPALAQSGTLPAELKQNRAEEDWGGFHITIDDSKAYRKPWTVTEEVRRVLNTNLLEFICNENNRDLVHLPGRFLQ
jgi:hypothetical protein